jgi:hypothetical protein
MAVQGRASAAGRDSETAPCGRACSRILVRVSYPRDSGANETSGVAGRVTSAPWQARRGCDRPLVVAAGYQVGYGVEGFLIGRVREPGDDGAGFFGELAGTFLGALDAMMLVQDL